MSHETGINIMKVLLPKISDVGNFKVHRVLPAGGPNRMMVGPFIFWDQIGPGEFVTDQGIDVRPHPHIGLETVTYLFKGALDHRDSLGSFQTIVPGDVNLMTAGRGIVHSERTPRARRVAGEPLYGIQSWLVLPQKDETCAPAFHHHVGAKLPTFTQEGATGRLIMGNAFGLSSPVRPLSDTLYMEVRLSRGQTFSLPPLAEEQGIYLISGEVSVDGTRHPPMRLLVAGEKKELALFAEEDAHFMVLGGAAVEGPRYLWWNFVASDPGKFESAAHDWQEGRFPTVPGDADDFIPCPPRS
ncbi:MAG: pirin family protein [Alphaproteobacteria bacterium]|jgi:redox-sensitive bicupin YhaK (pirin superfamily)|nr:pirin family protein [Alphaproteobacteria bacterium]